jgi:integrase
VIKASDRKKRNLFLTFSDEIKLLRACETEDRRHLRALIIVAVDTGARFGELIHLKKAQIDFTCSGTIYGLLNYKDLGGDKQTRNAKMTREFAKHSWISSATHPQKPSRFSVVKNHPRTGIRNLQQRPHGMGRSTRGRQPYSPRPTFPRLETYAWNQSQENDRSRRYRQCTRS